MKKFLISAAAILTISGFLLTASTAEAEAKIKLRMPTTAQVETRETESQSIISSEIPQIVSTVEISRHHETEVSYESCGKPITHFITVITYKNVYSDGTIRTYTRFS